MENSSSHDSAQYSTPPAQHSRVADRKPIDLDSLEPNLWKENHGNLLLGFTAVLCLIGVAIIACQQTRFSPPRFPSRLTVPDDSLNAHAAAGRAAAAAKRVRTIELHIVGAASDEGTMKIAMYISPDGFNDPQRAFEVDTWRIVDGVCTGLWEVSPDLKQVAIAAYHDANDNGELDKNALGIPSERYGFSGNARGFTGPPSFQEAAIMLNTQRVDISIR
ncbi:MAG: DUF2141 domain-containing protein [Planctomycetaceae bacterium]